MKVVVTGSSGLIGSALIRALTAGGHTVRRLVRRPPAEGDVRWDPIAGALGHGALDDADAVVHLAGESIAKGRWTAAKKARIRDSRVGSTLLLARSMATIDRRPKVFVSGSAVRLLRRPGRRAGRRRDRARSRLPGRCLQGMGGGDASGRGRRCPRRQCPSRSGAEPPRRRPADDVAAVSSGSRRAGRDWASVHELDRDR